MPGVVSPIPSQHCSDGVANARSRASGFVSDAIMALQWWCCQCNRSVTVEALLIAWCCCHAITASWSWCYRCQRRVGSDSIVVVVVLPVTVTLWYRQPWHCRRHCCCCCDDGFTNATTWSWWWWRFHHGVVVVVYCPSL